MTDRKLSYNLMLETGGVLRSHDLRLSLDRELRPGDAIAALGRQWLVTDVHASDPPQEGVDRRVVAREKVWLAFPSG